MARWRPVIAATMLCACGGLGENSTPAKGAAETSTDCVVLRRKLDVFEANMSAQLGDDETKPAVVAQRMRELATQADAFASDLDSTRFERTDVKALGAEFAAYSRNSGTWARSAAARFDRVAELLPQIEKSGQEIKERLGALSDACQRAPSGPACGAIGMFKRMPQGSDAESLRAFEQVLQDTERDANAMSEPTRADVLVIVRAFRTMNEASAALRRQSTDMGKGGPTDRETQALEAKASKVCGARTTEKAR